MTKYKECPDCCVGLTSVLVCKKHSLRDACFGPVNPRGVPEYVEGEPSPARLNITEP